MLIATGLLGGIGQILLTTSYRFADTSVIAQFEYTSILLAVIIGYTVFGEVPTMTANSGVCLIIIWRERQLGLERAKQRKAITPQG